MGLATAPRRPSRVSPESVMVFVDVRFTWLFVGMGELVIRLAWFSLLFLQL